MFPYDPQILAALETPPATIPNVLDTMQTIAALTVDGDGLQWFNSLYFSVTQAVESRVSAGGFADPAFLAELDVQFAQLYFNALKSYLTGGQLPDCWQTLFAQRTQTALTRIQFALAGVNAHINHDLPSALVSTCQIRNLVPQHGTPQYNDYSSLNSTLDSLIAGEEQTLRVRFLGDLVPGGTTLEDTIGAWSVSAAREAAWNNSELLWHLREESALSAGFLNTLDGLATLFSKAVLIPIP